MASFRLDVFKGLRPRVSPRLLPEGEAQIAENLRLGSGSLEPWNDVLDTEQPALPALVAIHRMYNNGTPIWLMSSSDIDFARGPVPNDELERTYYTGAAQPRMTYIGIAPGDYRYLGIPAPDSAPTLTGAALPDDAITGTMANGSITTNRMKADFVIEDNLPANLDGWFMSDGSGYSTPGTVRVYNMDFYVGQEVRVASVVDANTVTLEDARGGTYLARGTERARATGGNLHFRTEDSGTTRDGYFRFYLPNGVQVTFPSHGLQEGDVVRITSIPATVSLQLTQISYSDASTAVLFGAEADNGAGTAGSNTWPGSPVSVAADDFWIAGARAYPFIDVWSDANGDAGTNNFSIDGGFSWELIERGGVNYENIATDIESRVYVYTHVSELGEEGPPSPPSAVVTIPTGGEVEVGSFASPPTTQRNITHRRIYRANTGSNTTVLQFVAEIAIASSSYTDNVADTDLGEVLQTESWEPPPADLRGLTALPNGGMAGFAGKTVCFAEPYYPHAWPPEYQVAVDHDIVGLGVVPNGVAVLTKGPVYIVSGDHPRAMSSRHYTDSQACSSKRSITSTPDGVLYSAPDGLAFVGSSGFRLVTEPYVTKREWQSDFAPTTLKSFWHDGKYIAFADTGGFVFDPDDLSVGLTTHTVNASAGYLDTEEDVLYLAGQDIATDVEPLFVAVSSSQQESSVMTSPDGITWTMQATPTSKSWHGVTYSESLDIFVIVGTNAIATSPDGTTWTDRTPPAAITYSGVAWSPELALFAAVSTSGAAATSPDGVTWTARTIASQAWRCVVWDQYRRLFVAGCSGTAGAAIATSPDGINWTVRTTPGSIEAWNIAVGPNLLVTSTASGLSSMRSSDGITWVDSGDYVDNHRGITYGAGKYVAVGAAGATRAATSVDSLVWQAQTIPTASYYSVMYSEDLELFVAVSTNNHPTQVQTSPDGITWTARTTPSDQSWVAVGRRQAGLLIGVWDSAATKISYRWRSGKVVCDYPLNLGVARIVADSYPVTFRLYNDRSSVTPVTTRTIVNGEAFRLPGGYLTNSFEVQVEGTAVIRTVQLAETMQELLRG